MTDERVPLTFNDLAAMIEIERQASPLERFREAGAGEGHAGSSVGEFEQDVVGMLRSRVAA